MGVATVRKRSCVGAAATNERNGGWGRREDLLTIVALILFTIQTHKGRESEHYKCSQEYTKKAFEQVVTTDEEKLVSRL
jgi:hypothetical protein